MLLAAFSPAPAAVHAAEPPPVIDCSMMENPLFIGPVPHALECARLRAGTHGGQCVEFIQRLFGSYYTDPAFRGYARFIVPNADKPVVGDVVLTSGSIGGHAAIIYAIEGTDLILAESNFKGDEVISFGRRLPIDSPFIRGYFHFKQ